MRCVATVLIAVAVLADPSGGPPRIDLRGFGVFSPN